jgi:hypothetical protein
MAHVLHSNTIGDVGSLRVVIPNRPAAHKRAYVYCSTRGQRGKGSEAFIVYLDDLSLYNYNAKPTTVKKGLAYIKENLIACKSEWNKQHPQYAIT